MGRLTGEGSTTYRTRGGAVFLLGLALTAGCNSQEIPGMPGTQDHPRYETSKDVCADRALRELVARVVTLVDPDSCKVEDTSRGPSGATFSAPGREDTFVVVNIAPNDHAGEPSELALVDRQLGKINGADVSCTVLRPGTITFLDVWKNGGDDAAQVVTVGPQNPIGCSPEGSGLSGQAMQLAQRLAAAIG